MTACLSSEILTAPSEGLDVMLVTMTPWLGGFVQSFMRMSMMNSFAGLDVMFVTMISWPGGLDESFSSTLSRNPVTLDPPTVGTNSSNGKKEAASLMAAMPVGHLMVFAGRLLPDDLLPLLLEPLDSLLPLTLPLPLARLLIDVPLPLLDAGIENDWLDDALDDLTLLLALDLAGMISLVASRHGASITGGLGPLLPAFAAADLADFVVGWNRR